MQALIVYPEIEAFGGEERVLLGLSKVLHAEGIPHTILSYRDAVGLQRHADWPLNHVVLNPGPGGIAKARALARYLRKQSWKGQVLLFGLQAPAHAALAGLRGFNVRIADTPSLLSGEEHTAHRRPSAVNRLKDAALIYLAGIGLRRADHVIVNADYLGLELATRFSVQASTVYIGAPEVVASTTTPLAARLSPTIHILSVSRLERNKRLQWLIQAFDTVRQRHPDRRLVLDIAGAGSEEGSLRELAASLGPHSEVVFHGFVSDEELNRLYDSAAMFVMPAVQGFGLPALESLQRQTPVVMHRDSGASEILGGDPWVEIFNGGPAELADALSSILGRLDSFAAAPPPLPRLPTEREFGLNVAKDCGWL